MRPSKYSKALADRICKRLTEGESLSQICRDQKMPTRRTIHNWLLDEKKPEFFHKYTQATAIRADLIFDELLDIADTCVMGERVKTKSDGEQEVMTADMVERSKLRIDTRKWALARMAPKKYGDQLKVDHSGGVTVVLNDIGADPS